MDEDDITFGASVWGASEHAALSLSPPSAPQLSPAPSSSQDGYDDFEEFGTPAETLAASGDEIDEDFGDFGDFGEGVQAEGEAFEPQAFDTQEVLTPRPSMDWQTLRLDPMPPRQSLQSQINNILGPSWSSDDASHFTDEPIRQAEGLNQTLVTPESRQLYDILLPATQPTFKPVNWTRSRIRRQHLITLGIPVNLDEVLPRAGTKLPTLEIHTRPTSAPPAPYTGYTAPAPARSLASSRAGTPRPGTPRSGTPQPGIASTALATAQLRLGPKPQLDEAKLSALLNLDTNNLLLLPAATLNTHLADLKEQTAQTSALLTYLLQTRDALQQDSETYNKLIGELVGEAQKIKTGKRTTNLRSSTLS